MPQPDASHEVPSVDVTETSIIMAGLVHLIYHQAPVFTRLDILSKTILAAEKYDMQGALSRLRNDLIRDEFLRQDPVHAYGLACRFRWEEERRAAFRITLESADVYDVRHGKTLDELGVSAMDAFSLASLRQKRIERLQDFLDSKGVIQAIDTLKGIHRCSCGTKTADVTWPSLKASLMVEMSKRPLGDTLCEQEHHGPKGSIMKSFEDAKCRHCGRSLYSLLRTMSKIKSFVTKLTDF
jgi:hypothetical protein